MNKRTIAIAAASGVGLAALSGGVGYAIAHDDAAAGYGPHHQIQQQDGPAAGQQGPRSDDARSGWDDDERGRAGMGMGGGMSGGMGMAGDGGRWDNGRGAAPGADAAALADGTASAADAASLQDMVEEEKLAHDLYVALADAWDLRVFTQIASAESQHADAVRGLLDAYGVEDPTAGLAAGEFADADLQRLYDTLLERGLASQEAALTVGGLVEETDIRDLRAASAGETAIEQVYDRLEAGSESHLRAFAVNLDRLGVTYTAQVLDASEVSQIVGR